MAGATKPLTAKQEAFAVAYVATANAAEAYRRAYDVAPDARDEWIYVEALQLTEHPKVGPRIKELEAAAKKRSEFTVLKALKELEEARGLAMKEKLPSAAVSAVSAKIKLTGLEPPTKNVHRVTGPDDGPVQVEVSPKDRLREFIASKSR